VLTAALLLGVPLTSQAAQEFAHESSPLSCFQLLEQQGEVDENIATQLCQGAQSTAPAECLLRVLDEGDLSVPNALQLCQYARPEDDPAGCYLKARAETFLESWRAVQLCRPAVNLYYPLYP
jgi:hypothetical protein